MTVAEYQFQQLQNWKLGDNGARIALESKNDLEWQEDSKDRELCALRGFVFAVNHTSPFCGSSLRKAQGAQQEGPPFAGAPMGALLEVPTH